MGEYNTSFFMGAIGAGGYRSYLGDIYSADKGWRAYLIKGVRSVVIPSWMIW